MRSKSPELMSEIKKYIEDYYLQNRQSPSTTKIAEAVGIARGTAYKYLVEMAEKNMIEYDGQEISTNVTRKYSGEQTQTPIVGSIPCGSPQYEEENIEEYVSLPTAIFGKGDFFILRASGQSMIDAGIGVWKDGLLVRLRLAVLLVRWQVARFQTENRQGTQLQKTVGAIPLPAWDSVQAQR